MNKLRLSFTLATLALVTCTLVNAQPGPDFRTFRGDDNCPRGYRLATLDEVLADRRSACDALDEWDIARLENGASISGPGYRCKTKNYDRRELGDSLCVRSRSRVPEVIRERIRETIEDSVRGSIPDRTSPRERPQNDISTRHYYKLTTQFRGSNNCLDVYNGGDYDNRTHLTGCASFTGQNWRFQQSENPGYYRLSTEFRGSGMCLDITNGGRMNNQPMLVPCANYSGQFWKVSGPDSSGYYRLTTQFRGTNMCLDVFNGGQYNNMLQLTPCGGYTGQFWQLQRDRRI